MARLLAVLAFAAAAAAGLVQRGGGWGESTCTPTTMWETTTCYETEIDTVTVTDTTTCYETEIETDTVTSTCYETDYITTTEWSPPQTVYATTTCYETVTTTAPCSTTWATGW